MKSNNSAKRITIRDLARELGVSDRTVSQALHPRESNVRLNPQTAERIRLHAEARNYRVHSSARAIRTGRSLNMGYFEAKQYAVAFPLFGAVEGVQDASERNGYRVVMIKVPEPSQGRENPIPFIFREAHLDGLIVAHLGHLSAECKEAIETCGLPVVFLNEKKPVNAVYVDDFSGFQFLTQRLIEKGCRRLAFLKSKTQEASTSDEAFVHYSVKDRLAGFHSALANAGLEGEEVALDALRSTPALRTLLKKRLGLEAIMCPGDLMALQLFQALYSSKVRVPEELWITGFGGDFNSQCAVPLTSMRIPFYEMGTAAAEMVFQLLDLPKGSTLPSRVFSCELIEQDSTRSDLSKCPA